MTKAVSRLLSTVLSAPVLLLLFVGPLTGSPLQQDDGAALYEALVGGQPDLVRQLLDQGADPDARGPDGTPVLMAAVDRGDSDIVKVLLTGGADANVPNAEGFTALMMAAEGGNLEMVVALLDAGADVNVIVKGWSALWGALDDGNPEIIEIVLQHGADVNAALPSSLETEELCRPGQWACPSTTLLMLASGSGEPEFVKTLLKYGADVTAQDAAGRNALSYAEDRGHSENAEILRDAGVPEMEEAGGDPTAQPAYTILELAALGIRLDEVAERMDEVPSAHGQPEADNRREWEISVNVIAQAERWNTRLEWLATAYYLSSLASDENSETAWYFYHAATRPVFDWMGEQMEWTCAEFGTEAVTATVMEGVTEFCAIGREIQQLLLPALEELDS